MVILSASRTGEEGPQGHKHVRLLIEWSLFESSPGSQQDQSLRSNLKLSFNRFASALCLQIDCVESGEIPNERLPTFQFDDPMVNIVGLDQSWTPDMLVRPRDLADRLLDGLQLTFTLPLEAARSKAREIIDQSPQSGFTPIIERWRQLPDGQIEFAMRHFPVED